MILVADRFYIHFLGVHIERNVVIPVTSFINWSRISMATMNVVRQADEFKFGEDFHFISHLQRSCYRKMRDEGRSINTDL